MELVLPKIPQLLTMALGFGIFVWVLSKYAWGPIIDMLDDRRAKIDGDYAAAEKNLEDADVLKGDFESKLADIKAIEREKVQEAVKKGETLADGIVSKARGQADETKQKASQDIELETQKAQLQLRDSVVSMALGAAEKIIGERLDDDLHRKLIADYIDDLPANGGAPHA